MASTRTISLAFTLMLTTSVWPTNAFQRTPQGLLESDAKSLSATHSARQKRHCNWGPNGDRWHSSRASAIWTMAAQEEKVDPTSVTKFACDIPKVPWSWVEKIQAMNHTKTRMYNFQGAQWWASKLQKMGNHWPQFEARNWVLEFAKANFTDEDLLRITDIEKGYVPMGPWDKSDLSSYDSRHAATKSKDWQTGEYGDYLLYFDEPYFQEMASSNFTLCPGGDRPWSMRFYESILAGSIPIVGTEEFDKSAKDMWPLWRIPYHYYLKDSGKQFVYSQDWVDENLELFIRYQTFHEGDNEAPKGLN